MTDNFGPRRVYALLVLLLLFAAAGCTSTSNLAAPKTVTAIPLPTTPVWAAAWGNSPENAFSAAGSEETFRMPFRPTLSGTQERLHFSNFFGTTPVTIGAARLAVNVDGTPT